MTRNEKILNLVEGPDVLDIGCADHSIRVDSPYWLHGKLIQKFPTTAGIDLSAENIQRLRELGYKNLTVASAEDFDLGVQFNTIVAGELIEHLSNPGLFFARCREHLKENGKLIISTPYPFALLNILYAFLKYPKTCQNDQHAAWFCPKTLTELAARHDFYTESWQLIEDYEFENNSRLYLIFARLITTLGRVLLPARVRNNSMIFVFRYRQKK